MKLALMLLLVVLASGCVTGQTVAAGDTVSVFYTGTLEDGTVFDSNEGGAPLTFVAGAGQMIAGFDEGVLGMAVDEERTLTIPPEKAYGNSGPLAGKTLVFKVRMASITKP